MKKITVLFLITIILSSCSPQVSSNTLTPTIAITNSFTPTITRTPQPTLTATATLIPCPELENPVIIDDIKVIFYEKVSSKDCHDIQKFVRLTKEKFNSLKYETGPVDVHVFEKPDNLAHFQYDVVKNVGCNPDAEENILKSWQDHGPSGQSTRGAVFLLTGSEWHEVDKAHAIVHEIAQAMLINILGSCQKRWQVPDWYGHGLVEYYVEIFIPDWGLKPWNEDLYKCQLKLVEIRAGQECAYMEAQMAFWLLQSAKFGGKDRGLDVILEMTQGKSFNQAFYDVYNISVSAFSDEFDTYRLNGYKLIEATPTP